MFDLNRIRTKLYLGNIRCDFLLTEHDLLRKDILVFSGIWTLTSSQPFSTPTFIAFGACIKGFPFMSRVIVIDGAHLSGKYRGVMLVAACQDGNRGIYP